MLIRSCHYIFKDLARGLIEEVVATLTSGQYIRLAQYINLHPPLSIPTQMSAPQSFDFLHVCTTVFAV